MSKLFTVTLSTKTELLPCAFNQVNTVLTCNKCTQQWLVDYYCEYGTYMQQMYATMVSRLLLNKHFIGSKLFLIHVVTCIINN